MPKLNKLFHDDGESLLDSCPALRLKEDTGHNTWPVAKQLLKRHSQGKVGCTVISLLLTVSLTVCLVTVFTSSYYRCSKGVSCSEGWHSFHGSCYKFFNEYNNISVCRADCQNEGGDLASIHSMAENDFLESFIIKRPRTSPSVWRDTWIAAYIEEVDGLFRWLDGSPWDFSNWDSGEPDRKSVGRTHHECVFMGKNTLAPGKWWDGVCTWSRWTFDCICKQTIVNC